MRTKSPSFKRATATSPSASSYPSPTRCAPSACCTTSSNSARLFSPRYQHQQGKNCVLVQRLIISQIQTLPTSCETSSSKLIEGQTTDESDLLLARSKR